MGDLACPPKLEERRRSVWPLGFYQWARQERVKPEWRLDKAQNIFIERLASGRVRESGEHNLPGELVHFCEDGFCAAVFCDRSLEPVGLFCGQGKTDGFRFHLGRPSEAVAGLAFGPAID